MVSASSLTDSIISVHTKDAPSLMFTMDRSYAEQYFIKTGSNTIDVHMASLRKKLGQVGNQIETVRGVGYRFSDLAH